MVGLLLAGCSARADRPGSNDLQGRILVWHSWSGTDAEALTEILDKFVRIHPGARVKLVAVDPDELRRNYVAAATSGLGPDLIVGPNEWIRPLADAGLIQNIDGLLEDEVLQRYAPAALDTLRYRGGLYGVPESLRSMALYYNRSVVDAPAISLDELMAQAAAGRPVAINTGFYAAFWGIQAFGGRLFDEEGRTILDRGGFVNWLAWLKNARQEPGIILDVNQELLKSQFKDGQVAYYVGTPDDLSDIIAGLGEENVGVVPLPAGPNGNSGPFLGVEAFMFNASSSQSQLRLSLEVARFVTNAEQEAVLMRRARRVPANIKVKVDPRFDAVVGGFIAQARTAVPVPNRPQMDAVLQRGNDAYAKVLEGVLGPAEAALELTVAINGASGFEPMVTAPIVCKGVGTVRLWHGWQGDAAAALDELIGRFTRTCPTIIVRQRVSTPDELRAQLDATVSTGLAPDLVIGPNEWITGLAAAGLIKDITEYVDAETLQRYRPAAVEAMRYGGALYGLPQTMELMVLYYNRDLVSSPARNVDDLLMQAARDRQVALNTRFFNTLWAISAFGGRLFDDHYRVVLDQGGFADWLAWLQLAKSTPGMVLSTDVSSLKAQFKEGKAAYYVDGPRVLKELQDALGAERLGLALLPSGPAGDPNPLLHVTGFLFSASSSDAQTRLALEFVRYTTNVDSQTLFMERVNAVPANASVDISGNPTVAMFVEQAKTARPLPNVAQLDAVREFGGDAYAMVLEGALDPAEAAAEITRLINEANDFETAASRFACTGNGAVTLWHDRSGTRADALNEVIAGFAAECPEIGVESLAVAPGSLREALEKAVGSGGGPDLFIAPGGWTGELAQSGLVTDITDLVPATEVGQYMPPALDALRYRQRLYGLPESLHVAALYYNRELVGKPAETVDELLAHAAQGMRVTLSSDFYRAFWGIQAFGGQLFDTAGQVVLDQGGFADWLAWLKKAQQSPGTVVDSSDRKLRALFKSGRVAYYVGEPEALEELQAALGVDRVGVAPLPAGPAGSAGPLVSVDGFMFNAASPRITLALQFARYVAGRRNQLLLASKAGQVPVVLLVNGGARSVSAVFVAQAQTGVALPNGPEMQVIWEPGNEAYVRVLTGQALPSVAASEATQRMNEAIRRFNQAAGD